MATTAAVIAATADDAISLRSGDLRNPMFHLLNSEKNSQGSSAGKKKTVQPSLSRSSSTASSSSTSSCNNNRSKEKHFLPESVCHRVTQSWDLVKNDLKEVGLNFLLRLFEESPELLSLLPYGQSYLDTPPSQRKEKLRRCSSLRVHSVHVMTAVGNCVAGLNDIESVVPALRSLGKTHRMAGVEDGHYKKLFKHLSGAIREKIGPTHWDEETAEAWELVYFSLASIMIRPVTPLEAEPVTGYHELLVATSLYMVVVTPFRLAGFAARVPVVELVFAILDAMSILLFVVDLCSGRIVSALRVKPTRNPASVERSMPRKRKGRLHRRFHSTYIILKVHALRKLRSISMDQWESWPRTDLLVIASFIPQYSWYFTKRLPWCVANASSAVGVHWFHAFGLLRLAATARIVHAVRCTENNMLLRKRVDQDERRTIRIAKLLLTLVYVTHVSACLWCTVARIQLGPGTVAATPSEFFPEPRLLMGQSGVINSYVRALHWSWVNLAGIGNFDSNPVSTLECVATLLIHVCGVFCYAVMTGHVVSILEELTSKDNKIGTELADLGSFMMDCHIPRDAQKRIMQGYLMRNMIEAGAGVGQDDGNDMMGADVPSIGDNILSSLPRHLQNELRVYERAEALQRRDKSFQNCSADFVFALSGELRGSQMLLPGDYLLNHGEVPRQVLVLDSGTMEIEIDGKTIKILRKGDLLGKPWLLKALRKNCNLSTIPESEDRADLLPVVKHVAAAHSFSEWLDVEDSVENVKVRSMSDCRLATGLSSPYDVRALQKRFPKDFAALQEDRQRVVAAVQKVNVTRHIIRAQMAFKRQLRHAESA